MNLFITSALQKNDMRAVSLQLAMDLLHKNVTVEYGKMIRLFLVVLGKEGSYNWPKEANKCRTSKLEQGICQDKRT